MAFVHKKVYGRTWNLKCNTMHKYNFTRKISFNLLNVYEAYNHGLKEHILDAVGRNPKAIILFGSYRKGDDNEESDIDIAVEVNDNKDMRIIELGVIPKFG